MSASNYNLAVQLYNEGFNVIPCGMNKIPQVKGWTNQRMTQEGMKPHSWDLIGLSISQTQFPLECIDFDLKADPTGKVFEDFKKALNNPKLFEHLFIQRTMNNGFHIVYRLEETIEEGNQKLAVRAGCTEAMIETRGPGGYFGLYHNNVVQGDIMNLPTLTVEARNLLIEVARGLNEVVHSSEDSGFENVMTDAGQQRGDGNVSSLQLYREKTTATDFLNLLLQDGWNIFREEADKWQVARPGLNPTDKDFHGSATLFKQDKILNLFSPNANVPIREKGYDISSYIQETRFNGDIKATGDYLDPLVGKEKLTMIKPKIGNLPQVEEQAETDLPRFTQDIYNRSPELLQTIVGLFGTKVQKEVAYLSTITALSGIMPNMTFSYDERTLYLNLYYYLLGPAASGKGTMTLLEKALSVVDKYHKSNEEELGILAYVPEDPDAQPFEIDPLIKLLFPANVSSKKLYRLLDANKGRGVFFASEADTMVYANAQDWGNYTDIFRAAYHHETVSLSRDTNDEEITVENPQLSTLISSTYDQMVRLLKDPENGTVSRFTFYTIGKSPVRKNMLDEGGLVAKDVSMDSKFLAIGEDFVHIYKYCQANPTYIRFNEGASKLLGDEIESMEKYFGSIGVHIEASTRRMGIVIAKMAVQFAILNQIFEDKNPTPRVTETELQLAIELGRILIQHSHFAISKLTNNIGDIPNRNQFILDCHAQGMSQTDIAERVGMSRTGVEYIISKNK